MNTTGEQIIKELRHGYCSITLDVDATQFRENAFTPVKQFLEEAFELAFGDDAINKEYSMKEVIDALREQSQVSVEENFSFPSYKEQKRGG